MKIRNYNNKEENQMKRLVCGMLGTLLMMNLVSLPVYGAESAEVAEDHLALAASYEEKAALQDDLIAEHTKMKQDYKDRFFVNEKVTPLDKIRAMEAHCDAIIKTAEEEKAGLLDFSKWHRMRAAELQGQ